MTELYYNSTPHFTRWVIDNGALTEPFVVVDAGCQGGMHPRWEFLGRHLEFHGFDPIRAVCDSLRGESKPGRYYHNYALGSEDGERPFAVLPNAFESSFYATDRPGAEVQTTITMTLDAVYRNGILSRADHIKLDCEGAEPEILAGAQVYLIASNPVSVQAETNFHTSPIYPRTHFQAVNDQLYGHRLRLFDLNMIRALRPAFAEAPARFFNWQDPDPMRDTPRLDIGAPTTCDALYCRDWVADEADQAGRYFYGQEPTVDKLLKAMISFELYGLPDCAYEIAGHFHEELARRIDVDKAMKLLLIPPPHARNTGDVVNCLAMLGALREQVRQERPVNAARRAWRAYRTRVRKAWA